MTSKSHYRWIQLPKGGSVFQARVWLLPYSNLHSVLYVGHRVVGLILVGPGSRPSQGILRGDDTSHNGNADLQHKRVPTSSLVHQSNRRVDWRLPDIRIRSPPRVRPRQLRFQIGHLLRKIEETSSGVQSGTWQHFWTGESDIITHTYLFFTVQLQSLFQAKRLETSNYFWPRQPEWFKLKLSNERIF